MKHLNPVSRTPRVAQISNFQIKLEGTTEIIDRVLLAYRQQPWKIRPIDGESGTDTGNTDNTDTGNVEV